MAKDAAVSWKFEASTLCVPILTPQGIFLLITFSPFVHAARVPLSQGQGVQCCTHWASSQLVGHPENPSLACPRPANITKTMALYTAIFEISRGSWSSPSIQLKPPWLGAAGSPSNIFSMWVSDRVPLRRAGAGTVFYWLAPGGAAVSPELPEPIIHPKPGRMTHHHAPDIHEGQDIH